MRPQDLRKLMEQAQQMQEQMTAHQEQLATQTFVGTAGGGVVTATVTGSGSLVSVEIAPEVIDPEDAEMLGDLIVAATNQALAAANEASQAGMGGIAGGLDLGGLLG
ncbi:MAG: YbaB/EbfC family nucleoid-associated protein [Acidimicrobiia bacterium]|nr:YbaB/EbfC family nucleoid-associated protein [Acidimicrobiia bacterium]